MSLKSVIRKVLPVAIENKYRNQRRKKEVQENQGDKVFCPICESSFEKFASAGRENRPNCRCFQCDSRERHRLIWLYLHDKMNVMDKSLRLLHFAPERMFYNYLSQKNNIEYFPCDIQPKKYRYKGNTKITQADITDIPFEAEQFDLILCNHVLEHIPDDKKAMSELFRVMKKGGNGIFLVPIDYNRETTYEDPSITSPKARLEAFGQEDHVRWYGGDYIERLKEAGFEVIELDYAKEFSEEDQHKYGLLKDELVYHCIKP